MVYKRPSKSSQLKSQKKLLNRQKERTLRLRHQLKDSEAMRASLREEVTELTLELEEKEDEIERLLAQLRETDFSLTMANNQLNWLEEWWDELNKKYEGILDYSRK